MVSGSEACVGTFFPTAVGKQLDKMNYGNCMLRHRDVAPANPKKGQREKIAQLRMKHHSFCEAPIAQFFLFALLFGWRPSGSQPPHQRRLFAQFEFPSMHFFFLGQGHLESRPRCCCGCWLPDGHQLTKGQRGKKRELRNFVAELRTKHHSFCEATVAQIFFCPFVWLTTVREPAAAAKARLFAQFGECPSFPFPCIFFGGGPGTIGIEAEDVAVAAGSLTVTSKSKGQRENLSNGLLRSNFNNSFYGVVCLQPFRRMPQTP